MTVSILLRRALADFRLRFWTQIMTTLVVSLSLTILSFFALLNYNLGHVVERFGSELGLVVFLKSNVSQERIPTLYHELALMPEVQSVEYISPEEAFKRLARQLGNEKGVLEGVSPQFLPPSFEVRVNRAVFHLERIREIAARITAWPETAKVQYGQEWIERLSQFSRFARNVVIIAGLLLLVTAAFVVANTIKLTVYARQEELEILRLVGATNAFIQGPFFTEAFIQGLAGSLIAVGINYLCYTYVRGLSATSQILHGLTLSFLPWSFVALIVVITTLFCVAGTGLAMRRFLRL